MDENNKNMAEDARRESGEPGGGQGRRDEVGQSPIYPVSADKLPADNDAYIRTAGELGQRGPRPGRLLRPRRERSDRPFLGCQ